MRDFFSRTLLVGICGLISGCIGPSGQSPAGVSSELAGERAEHISQVRYEIFLSIPPSADNRIQGIVKVHFQLSDAERPIIFDFSPGEASDLLSSRLNGEELDPALLRGQIVLPKRALQVGANTAEFGFLAGDMALNRREEYLYTLFVPDRASTAFPCFDQPDIKSRFKLDLELPEGWVAVSNGLEGEVEGREDGRSLYRFRETEPISTYLFAFAAGIFRVESGTVESIGMRIFHREQDQDRLIRNLAALFRLHETSLIWLQDYTAIPYPFGKFDIVLLPDFQFGGMEHPGAIFYRDSRLLLEESATREEELGRASLIAHETAHMWFGNLVTMRWFNDVWMKEVFASFIGAKIVNPSYPDLDHELRFLLSHYPEAYEVDRSRGTHPIRQELDNLNDAASLYGAIIYKKAPVVMAQLESLIGERVFKNGIKEYLKNYRFANADWPDLIAILDRLDPRDLEEWSRVWVESSGRPTIKTELVTDPGNRIQKAELTQYDPFQRGLFWPQKLVLWLGPDSYPIEFTERQCVASELQGQTFPGMLLTNGGGLGYGRFELDWKSFAYLQQHIRSIDLPVSRAAAWILLWDAMLESRLSPEALLRLVLQNLPEEKDELIAEYLLQMLTETFWKFLNSDQRIRVASDLENILWEEILKRDSPSLKSACFKAFRRIVLSEAGIQRLVGIWEGTLEVEGLTFAERDREDIVLELAIRGIETSDQMLEQQIGHTSDTERRDRLEFLRPSVSVDFEIRSQFFNSLVQSENRTRETWVLEAVSFLNHPLRASQSIVYLQPGLELLEELKRTGTIFFPKGWLDALLRGHQSREAREIIDRFLAAHQDYPPRLRAKILQSADLLFRAAEIVEDQN